MMQKREQYATDLEQFHELIRQMNAHKAALENTVAERTNKFADTNQKLDKMMTHINDLKQMIKEQEFSVDDIHKLESELKGLSEATDRVEVNHEKQRKMLLASEKELVAACNNVDSIVARYNSTLAALLLIQDLGSKFVNKKAKFAGGKLLSTFQIEVLGINIKDVQNVTSASLLEYAEKIDNAKSQHQDVLDSMNHSEDSLKQADAKLQIVHSKKSKCEQTLDADNKSFSAKLAVRTREVESIETKSAALQDPVQLEEQLMAYEQQCLRLEQLRRQHQEENVAKKRAVVAEVSSAAQLMLEHESYRKEKSAKVKAMWTEIMESVPDIVLPTNALQATETTNEEE
jgi:chromosome segregation ATPase